MSIASVDKFVLSDSTLVDELTSNSYSTVIRVQQATVGGAKHSPIVYSSLFPLPVKGAFPIYATSNDTTISDDACNPLPASTPDLSSHLVIIRRGTCTFVSLGCCARLEDTKNEYRYKSWRTWQLRGGKSH
jgi:hypothetical protein